MWIANHVQSKRPFFSSEFRAMLNQCPSNSTTLHFGIDKQRVQFSVAICSRLNRRKSSERAIPFRNEHSATGDLFSRKLNRVRVSE